MNKSPVIEYYILARPYLESTKSSQLITFIERAITLKGDRLNVEKMVYAMRILDAGVEPAALRCMFVGSEEYLKMAQYFWRGKEKNKEGELGFA